MATKFTFKTDKPKGKWAWLDSPSHLIKLDGDQVGEITDKEFKITLTVCRDGNDTPSNCPWKRITLAHKSSTLEEAKSFLNDHFQSVTKQFNLYKLK